MKVPRTWREEQAHPAVQDVSVEPGEEAKYWIYLQNGYSAAADPGAIHQGNGRTIQEAIWDTFPVVPCTCDDCTAVD